MDPTRPQPICTLYPFKFDNYILCFPAEFAYADGPFLQLPLQLCVTWIKVNAVLHHGCQRPNANDAKTVHVYNYFRKWKFCDRSSGTRAMFGRSTRNLRYSLQSIEYKQMSERTMNGRLRKDQLKSMKFASNSFKILTFPKWRSDGRAHCLRDR